MSILYTAHESQRYCDSVRAAHAQDLLDGLKVEPIWGKKVLKREVKRFGLKPRNRVAVEARAAELRLSAKTAKDRNDRETRHAVKVKQTERCKARNAKFRQDEYYALLSAIRKEYQLSCSVAIKCTDSQRKELKSKLKAVKDKLINRIEAKLNDLSTELPDLGRFKSSVRKQFEIEYHNWEERVRISATGIKQPKLRSEVKPTGTDLDLKCDVCEQPFPNNKPQSQKKLHRFCSIECANFWHRKKEKPNA